MATVRLIGGGRPFGANSPGKSVRNVTTGAGDASLAMEAKRLIRDGHATGSAYRGSTACESEGHPHGYHRHHRHRLPRRTLVAESSCIPAGDPAGFIVDHPARHRRCRRLATYLGQAVAAYRRGRRRWLHRCRWSELSIVLAIWSMVTPAFETGRSAPCALTMMARSPGYSGLVADRRLGRTEQMPAVAGRPALSHAGPAGAAHGRSSAVARTRWLEQRLVGWARLGCSRIQPALGGAVSPAGGRGWLRNPRRSGCSRGRFRQVRRSGAPMP